MSNTRLSKWQYSNDDESHKYLIDANEHQCDRYIHLTDHKLFSLFFCMKSRVEREKNSDIEHLTKKASRQHFCETAFFYAKSLPCSFHIFSFILCARHALHCSSTANQLILREKLY